MFCIAFFMQVKKVKKGLSQGAAWNEQQKNRK